MLNSEPVGASTAALNRWRELGPLTVEDIIAKTTEENRFIPTEHELEFRKIDVGTWYYEGLFKTGTSTEHGIVR